MRSSMEKTLAQEAAYRLVAAACGERSSTWNRQEQLHEAATTQPSARAAATPLLEICATCPIISECATWARLDEYTGIAAGTAWVDGKPRPVHWVRRHRPRRRLAS